jgi:hypothetical protein
MNQLKIFFIVAFCCILNLSIFAQPESLYIIGGPFNANKPNWIFRDVVPLDKDSENPYVFYYRGYIGYNTFGDEPGNFKILTSNNSWDGYHPDGNDNQLIGTDQVGKTLNIRFGGADTKWSIPSDRSGDGYYSIKIDTQNNTFTIESFTAVSSAEFPVGLFCVGGPFIIDDPLWSVDEAKKLERDAVDPNLFHFRGYLEHNQWGNEPGNFKILINARDWSDSFHPGNTEENVSLCSAIKQYLPVRRNGSDNKWYLPEDGSGNGYWEFSINAENQTLRVDSFVQDFDYFDHVYITGSAMPCGWTDSNPEVMNKISRGIYSWTGTLNVGEFKFLKYLNSWTSCYVANSSDESVILNNEHDIVYEKNYNKLGNDYKFAINDENANKQVTITLNLITKKMTVSHVINNISSYEKPSVNIYTQNRKIFINGLTNESYRAQIFSIDGKKISQKIFSGNTELLVQPGKYIVKIAKRDNKVILSKVVIVM